MKLRVIFAKTGTLRYTGHLDLQKIWERTVRRARLPLAYSHGFHPQPKIQLASALPLGFIGRAEIVDICLQDEIEGEPVTAQSNVILQRLQDASPPGLIISSLEQVDEHIPALQTQVIAADYEVTLLDQADEAGLAQRLTTLMEAACLPRERRGKSYDLRALIETLTLLPADADKRVRLAMRLAARQGATGRPEEVLAELGIPFEAARVERIRLIFREELLE